MKKIQVFNCTHKERPYTASTVVVVDNMRAYPFLAKNEEAISRIIQRLKQNFPFSFCSIDDMNENVENLVLVHEEVLDTEN